MSERVHSDWSILENQGACITIEVKGKGVLKSKCFVFYFWNWTPYTKVLPLGIN